MEDRSVGLCCDCDGGVSFIIETCSLCFLINESKSTQLNQTAALHDMNFCVQESTRKNIEELRTSLSELKLPPEMDFKYK